MKEYLLVSLLDQLITRIYLETRGSGSANS